MTFLENLGVDKRQWAKVIYRFPALLTYSRQKVEVTVDFLSENNLKCEIITLIKCDVPIATEIIGKMEDLGLSICKSFDDPWNVLGPYTFEIIRFARMRGYVTDSEIQDYSKRQLAYEKMMEEYENELFRRKKDEP